MSRAELSERNRENVLCLDSECEGRPRKDSRSSSIAIKAAQEAKEAQEAQQIAGAQAAHQGIKGSPKEPGQVPRREFDERVTDEMFLPEHRLADKSRRTSDGGGSPSSNSGVKAQLAEKAEQAARAAEAALSGKLVLVEQLEHEVREAEAVVQEEAASCQRTQLNLQVSLTAASQAARLLRSLTCALQISQSTLANSQQAAEGAQQELAEKSALLDAAKCRVEALLRELCVARQDLAAIKQAACKAQTAARNASCCAQRNRRQLRHSQKAKIHINRLLNRVIGADKLIREQLSNTLRR